MESVLFVELFVWFYLLHFPYFANLVLVSFNFLPSSHRPFPPINSLPAHAQVNATEMPSGCPAIVSMARVHQLTSHLLFKNKQHQLPLKSPVKTSSKGWLVHLIKARCLLKNYFSLSSLHPFIPSLILPPSPPTTFPFLSVQTAGPQES